MNRYDVIVVGGGHAGIEAVYASSKYKLSILMITLSINKIGLTPCNPSIGGSAKGIVVREVDALGGAMGILADQSSIQMKILNTSRGPAVQSLRSQIDKIDYPLNSQKLLNNIKNVDILEDKVLTLIIKNKSVIGVVSEKYGEILAKSVVLTTGTYLSSLIMKGDSSVREGPDKQETTTTITKQLKKCGFNIIRLKTGTPPRVLESSINYKNTEIEEGIKNPSICFSFLNKKLSRPNIPSYLTYTNSKTHKIINKNLSLSPMYSGNKNLGVGPRYCPSIEDKIVRFKDKKRHQIFLEKESIHTNSIYIQGVSTSFPDKIQDKILKSISGLENCQVLRYGYAIEYDAIDPYQLKETLETKIINNLYSAGQINGTSGYEEAGAQGFIAGANAALKILNKNPFVLKRNEAHIGVMIDDLVTKGVIEPYRLLTSRSEFRLLLRSDNADRRLTKIGYMNGTVSNKRYKILLEKEKNIDKLKKILNNCFFHQSSTINLFLDKISSKLRTKTSASEIIRRPEITIKKIIMFLPKEVKEFDYAIIRQCEIEIKYNGYLKLQEKEVNKIKSIEKTIIPKNINYCEIKQLSKESMDKLSKYKPETLGQVSRITGLKPHDVLNISYYIKSNQQKYNY